MTDSIAAVERTARRFTDLLRSDVEDAQPVPRSTWAIRDVASHVATVVDGYTALARGGTSPVSDLARRREVNQDHIDLDRDRDVRMLADHIDGALPGLIDEYRALDPATPIAWHAGIAVEPVDVVGVLVGEFALHGLDVARAARRPWTITAEDAHPILDAFVAVARHFVDRTRVGRVDATVEVRFRGYETSTFHVRHGVVDAVPGRAARPDARVSIDPVAFLLVGYKRSPLVRQVAAGKALAWGRKPWLALQFPGWFDRP